MKKINKDNQYSLQNIIILLFLGITMSPLSTYILMNILHFPSAIPEIIYFPLFYFYKNLLGISYFYKKKTFTMLFISIFIWFLLLIISFLIGNYSVMSVLTTARAYLYIIIVATYFYKSHVNEHFYSSVMTISIGSLLGWIFMAIMNVSLILTTTNEIGSTATYGNMLAISFLISISLLKNRNNIFFIGLILSIIISITASLRRQISVSFASLILSFLFLWFTKTNSKSLIVIFISIILLFISMPFIETTVETISPVMHRRIFIKSEMLLSGNTDASDDIRFQYFKKVIDDSDNLLLPHGFVSKQTHLYPEVGIFVDCPLYEILYTFGLILVFPFTIFFLYRMAYQLRMFLFKKNINSAIFFIAGTILIFLLFIEGTYITFTYISPFTGVALGGVFKKNNLT